MELACWTVRIKGSQISTGTMGKFANPEEFARHILDKDKTFRPTPDDIIQVEASVFGVKRKGGNKHCLGSVLIGEYTLSDLGIKFCEILPMN